MDFEVSKTFLARLSAREIDALGGDHTYVHPASGTTRWYFGKLLQRDSVDVISVENPGRAKKLGKLLVIVAMSDDSDGLVIRDDRHLTCMTWYHEDESTEKTQRTFSQWLAEARRVDAGQVDQDSAMVQLPLSLVGHWDPVKVLTPGMKGHLKTVPAIDVQQDGQWIEHYQWPSKITKNVKVVSVNNDDNSFELFESGEINQYEYRFPKENRMVLIGPDVDYKVEYERTIAAN